MTKHAVTHETIDVGGVRLHVALAGDEAGDLVVLLHGFPDFWGGWARQIEALAQRGYRVAAPDMRGYNLSEKPSGVENYRGSTLAKDVAGLVRALGRERAVIAGHDWGGIVAWQVAALIPEVVSRLIILNAPHPATFARALRTPAQLRRSWYMIMFQLPVVPELMLGAGGFRVLRGLLRSQGVSREEIERHVGALRQPGALTGMVNYYRALRFGASEPRGVVTCPTLVLWGQDDPFLGPELAESPKKLVHDARVVPIPGARHWPQWDASERVNDEILAFIEEAS